MRLFRRSLFAPALFLSVAADRLPAQGRIADSRGATVIGVVVDSIRGGYLRNAIVYVSDSKRSAITDALGRFAIDSVEPGMHSLRLSHPLLDTIGVAVSTKPTLFRADSATTFVLSVPSALTVVHRKCSELDRKSGEGALIGVVVDADTEQPSLGANVVVAWTEYAVGTRSITKIPKVRSGKVNIDGTYMVCGIPTDLIAPVFATDSSDSTGIVTIAFDKALAIQALFLPSDRRTLADTTRKIITARRAASLTGHVVDPVGKPLAGARVALESDQVITVTNDDGAFSLAGLRSGTRNVTVRKLGFEAIQSVVNLSTAAPQHAEFRMRKTVPVLETVRVSAVRDLGLQRVGFSERKRLGDGKFLSPHDIEVRNPLKLVNLLETAPMLRAIPAGLGHRAITGRLGGCVRYFIDGVLTPEFSPGDWEMQPDSYLSTSEIGAIEVYDALSSPAEFLSKSKFGPLCSSVVIWTKTKLGL